MTGFFFAFLKKEVNHEKNHQQENYIMSKEENETLTNLIDAINVANYDSLVTCLKRQINYLKTDIPSIMKSIDPDHWYQIGHIMKDVQIKVDLLLKLCDFIEYVGVLQGMIIKEE